MQTATRALPPKLAIECLLVGVFASAMDYLVALSLVMGLHVAAPIGTTIGLTVGVTINFVLNRRVFLGPIRDGNIWPQIGRYVQAMGVLMVVHSLAIWTFRDRFHLPLVPVKMVADFLLFGCTQPFILRFFVFRTAPSSQDVVAAKS